MTGDNARFAPPPLARPAQPSPGPFSDPRVRLVAVAVAALVLLSLIVFGRRVFRVASAVSTQLTEAEKANRKSAVKKQLKELGVQFFNYESRYHAYPPNEASFRSFIQGTPQPALADFKCGQCGEKLTLLSNVAPSGSWLESSGYTYAWSAAGITDAAPPDLPIAWHRCPEQAEVVVLFFQGRVDSFPQGSDMVRKLEALGTRK